MMQDPKLNILNVMTTTRCTLRCKDCTSYYPEFQTPVDVAIPEIEASLKICFQIFRSIDEVRISGAEVFLYPHFAQLLTETLAQYRSQFGHILIITNGSYLPKPEVIQVLNRLDYPVQVRVDNYGTLSKKLTEVTALLRATKAEVDVRCYNESEQFMGGWVDLGHCKFQGYTSEELNDVFLRCQSRVNCALIWDNRYYGCGPLSTWVKLGKVPDRESDYVDLSKDAPIEQLREEVIRLNQHPFFGCNYCAGFDPERSPRIPAAIQL